MTSINRELMKGSTELILLAILERGPLYGYQIVKEVRAASADVLQLKEGSLYPALHKLERLELVTSYWQAREDGTSRRYYQLTLAGNAAIEEKRAEWTRFTKAINGVLHHA